MKFTHSLLLLSAVAMLGLAACDKDDDEIIGPTGTDAISFTVSVPRVTRAVVDQTTTETIDNFSTWAFTGPQSTLLMNNVRVGKEGGQWTYTPLMYWPADGQKVNFYSISPAYEGWDKPVAIGTVPDIEAYKVAGNVDLLYAVNIGASSATPLVNVNFRHALSNIHFLLKTRDADATQPPLRVEVDRVELLGVNSTGDFAFPRQTTGSDIAAASKGSWSNIKDPVNVDLYTGAMVNIESKTDAKEYNNHEPGYSYAMPQELPASVNTSDTYTGAWVRVRCAVYDEGSGVKFWPSASTPGYDGDSGYAYIYFPLSDPAHGITVNTWEVGKAYYYTLNIGVPKGSSTIEFDVTVDHYDDVTLVPKTK